MTHDRPTLRFLGDTDTVTGSRYLVESGGRRVLVDCGLFQGYKRSRERNRAPFPVPPPSIDAVASLNRFKIRDFDDPLDFGGGLELTFVPAGHILGASQVHITFGSQSVHFTGDLGRADDPFMFPPRPLGEVGVLVTESTYGNRLHSATDPEKQLGEIVTRVAKRGGVVLFAAFAVGRAETLMLSLSRLRRKNAIPDIPIFLNSPMAIDASDMYQRHPEEHRLREDEYRNMYSVAKLTRSVDESKLLNLRGGPMVIISASGMLTGGRILHHLAAYGPDPKNAIVLSGYQAGGTRGAALAAGERTVRIYGEDLTVRAEVIQMENLSAHADTDGLIDWMKAAPRAPRMTYITHGEPKAADALRIRIKRELGWRARIPEHLEEIDLADPT